MSRLLTAAQAQSYGLPEDDQERAAVLAAAEVVLNYVAGSPFAAEADARVHAERNDVGPDLFNRAIAYLEAAGQLYRAEAWAPAAAGLQLGDLTRYKKDTLLDIANVQGIEVKASANKDELAQALGG